MTVYDRVAAWARRTALQRRSLPCSGSNGANQDFKRAVDWYLQPAKAGYVRAQTNIGLMYARGYGVSKSMAEAAAGGTLPRSRTIPARNTTSD